MLAAQGSPDDNKPVPLDPENPSSRSGEQVLCIFGAGTNSSSVIDDLMFDPISWTVSPNLSVFFTFLAYFTAQEMSKPK